MSEEILDKATHEYVKLTIQGYTFIEPRINNRDIDYIITLSERFHDKFTRRLNKSDEEICNLYCDLLDKSLDNIPKLNLTSKLIGKQKKPELDQSIQLFQMLTNYSMCINKLLPDNSEQKQGFFNLAKGWFHASLRCIQLFNKPISKDVIVEYEQRWIELRNYGSNELMASVDKATRKLFLPGDAKYEMNRKKSQDKTLSTETQSFLQITAYKNIIKAFEEEIKQGNPPKLNNIKNLRLLTYEIKKDLENEIQKWQKRNETFLSLDTPIHSETKVTFNDIIKANEDFEVVEDSVLSMRILNIINTPGTLTERQKEVFLLYMEQFSYQDIADELGIAKKVAFNHYKAAITNIRKVLLNT